MLLLLIPLLEPKAARSGHCDSGRHKFAVGVLSPDVALEYLTWLFCNVEHRDQNLVRIIEIVFASNSAAMSKLRTCRAPKRTKALHDVYVQENLYADMGQGDLGQEFGSCTFLISVPPLAPTDRCSMSERRPPASHHGELAK